MFHTQVSKAIFPLFVLHVKGDQKQTVILFYNEFGWQLEFWHYYKQRICPASLDHFLTIHLKEIGSRKECNIFQQQAYFAV